MFKILILGGYGNFGARISRALAFESNLQLIIAGRNPRNAAALCRELEQQGATSELRPAELDLSAGDLAGRIAALRANLVIHSCGPWHDRNYEVARACLDAGANYFDLADGRDFVLGIPVLDAIAREKDLLLVSGASTLPAISSAVADSLKSSFSTIESIDIGIAPAQRIQRGLATVQSVLSYCGKPFQVWEGGIWKTAYGWQGVRRFSYPDLGSRILLRCNVPDLELFKERYSPTDTVRFDAGLELAVGALALWCLSWLSRIGVIAAPEKLAPLLLRIGRFLDWFGSDTGGMHVRLQGIDASGERLVITWFLTARKGCGPEIPALPAIVLAKKLASGSLGLRGAHACVNMISLDELAAAWRHLPIETQIVEQRR